MTEDKDIDEIMSSLENELWEISNEIFDEEIWNARTKEDMKDLSKKEIAKAMFGLGFITHQKIMDERIKDMEEEILKDPELSKSVESFKDRVGRMDEKI